VTKIHQKANGVTAGAAAKAMKKLFFSVYGKAGGFFGMKRAAGDKVVTRFFLEGRANRLNRQYQPALTAHQ